MSFLPFFSGKRICIGKTFAENAFTTVLPIVMKAFSNKEGRLGKFVDPDHYLQKPPNNTLLEIRPQIFIEFNRAILIP